MSGQGSSRIVLGTVQLGLPYGRLRDGGTMSREAAFAVLDAAWAAGIRSFDTAEAYGDSAPRLAAWLDERGRAPQARVVTKVQPIPPADLRRIALSALDRFRGVGDLVLLSHGPLVGSGWSALLECCRERGATAGQSVYSPAEVSAAVATEGVRRVQAPGNVFDRRALQARGAADVPLDLRSVYLQGVLLEEPAAAEARVPGAGRLAARVRAATEAVGLPADRLLCAALLACARPADRIVVGVDDPYQVAALAAAADLPEDAVERFLALLERDGMEPVDERVLDPRTW